MINNPPLFDFGIDQESPCVDAANPLYTDPDGTRLDMGACHFPFISLVCSPHEVTIPPGNVLPLQVTVENLLENPSFPVQVRIVARLNNGNEYRLFGPIPHNGISIPPESFLSGTVNLDVPAGIPEGFTCVVKSVLVAAETGDYVHQDLCDLTVSSGY